MNNIHNSRIEQYVQVFTGDLNDFNKIIENSAIETYFQVNMLEWLPTKY